MASVDGVSGAAVGRRVFAFVAGAAFLLGSLGLPSLHVPTAVAALPDGAAKYVPMAPQRLVDSRLPAAARGYTVVGNALRVDVAHRSGVPLDAVEAVLSVTIIGSAAPGYVTLYPTGSTVPYTSDVSADAAGRTIANLVHVRLGDGGSFDLRRSTSMDLAIDLVGVYVPVAAATGDGRFVARPAGAVRAFDTVSRGYGVPAGAVQRVELSPAGVPVGALAAVVTLTAVNAPLGFWTVYAGGSTRPTASSLNIDTRGQTRAVTAIVALGPTRAIDVYTLFGGHLLVDLIGWYTGPNSAAGTDGLFVPNDPARLLDTRVGRSLAPWAGSTFEFKPTPPAGVTAGAVALNITATSNWDPGYVAAHPAGTTRPVISNLNLSHWPATVASQVLVPLSTRGVAVYTSHGAHLIADLAGWFLGTPVAATQPVPTNPTRSPNRAVSVHVPKIGVNLFVRSGSNLDAIADAGYAATWSQLADVATPGNIMLFGHRTNAGGPFRNLHLLVPGDGFIIAGADGHAYLYRVVDKRVTPRQYAAAAGAASGWGPATAQLVACSKLDGTPTSTTYVIVITGRLVAVS